MMVEQFIDRLEQQGLLDKEIVDELRRRVAKVKGKKVTPEAIAKFLVDKGHLTRFQAVRLVNDVIGSMEAGTLPEKRLKADDELRLADEADDLTAVQDVQDLGGKPSRPAPGTKDDELLALTDMEDDTLGKKPSAGPGAAEVSRQGGPADKKPSDRKTKAKDKRAVAEFTPPPAPVRRPPEPPVPSEPIVDEMAADLEASGSLRPDRSERGGLMGLFGGGDKAAPIAQRKLQKTSEWDSMLLLVGGASLGVLLVIGAFLYLSLTRGAAEELIAAAESAYGEESYSQAIKLYDKYLEAYPNHEKASLASVRREIARLRQVFKNPEQGLKVANDVLPHIEQEESFPEARDELASMLPQIAGGFVAQAKLADDPATQEKLLAQTQAAMKLVDNPVYIPTTLRKSQQTTIDTIVEDVARVQREIDREKNLTQTINAINTAVASGDTSLAYTARQDLLDKYPGLETDEKLFGAVLEISKKERERVRIVNQPLTAVTEDRQLASAGRVVLAHRMGQPIASVNGHIAYVLAGGSVFALDASTGDVLWRRFVGFETTTHPSPLAANAAGADAIVVDRRTQEVMRLRAETGALVWRLAVGEPFADPVIQEDRIYIAARSGKLYVVDAQTGNADRHVLIPQALEVGPGVAAGREYLYQPGDQDNLYVVSTDTLECREVVYIGHKRGTITVPPVMALGYLFVVENAGPDFAYLHIFGTSQEGLNLKTAQGKLRLRGHVPVAPILGRRRVLVVTDRRAVELYDVDPNNESGTPVTTAGRHNATSEAPITSYPLMEGGYMWVANNRFTKYQVQASSGKLPSEWVHDEQDVYVGPLQLVRDAVIHVRRRQGAPGFTVGATRLNDENPSWQTEVAAPARGVRVQGDTATAVTARGRLFQIGAADIQRGVVTQALASAARDEQLTLSLSEAIDLGKEQWAFSAPMGYNQVVFYEAGGENNGLRMLTLTVPPGDATIEPTPFAGGILVPLRDGRVVLSDTTTGGERMGPFHPEVATGASIQWSRPAVLGNGQEFVIASSQQRVYRVGSKDKPQLHLAELASVSVGKNMVGPLAAVGNVFYGVARTETGDAVVCFSLPDVKAVQEWPLEGSLLWGPQQAGDAVFLATASQFVCLDSEGQQRWAVPLEHAPLVGRAQASDTHLLLAAEDGTVVRVDAATGATVATVNAGEPLASGAVAFGDRLLVAGKSGVLLVVDNPVP